MKTGKTSLFTRPLLSFIGTMILANVASSMHRMLLPLYVQSLGANIAQVGLFFTIAAIAPLAFQILGGWLSDSIGRLQAIAFGSIAGVFCYLVLFIATDWQWLLLAMVAMAVASAFVAPSFQAYIAEQTSQENLGKVYGISEGLFMIVWVIGPPLGGYLSDRYGFKVMFLVAGSLYTVATIVRLWMARGARQQAPKTSSPQLTFTGLKTSLSAMFAMLTAGGVVTWIFISDSVSDVSHNLTHQLTPLYLQNLMALSNAQIGLLAAIASTVTMLLMAAAGWLSDKVGERVGIAGGFASIAIGQVVFLSSSTFAGFAGAWVFFGIGGALINPAYNSLISKVVPNRLRGTAFGLFSTSVGVLSLPAPLIGAYLWERFDPRLPFFVPVVMAVLLLPVIWVKFKLPSDQVPTGAQVTAAAD